MDDTSARSSSRTSGWSISRGAKARLAYFRDFIDADVVDLFRVVASDAAELVPGLEAWEAGADPGDMDGDAALFLRYLQVLRMAARSGVVPEQLRDTVDASAAGLSGWFPRLGSVLRSIDHQGIFGQFNQSLAGLPRACPASRSERRS